MMLTTDLALKLDPIYGPISKRFHENPDQLADAFAKAWYKLLHRDMGPVSRFLGPWVPEPQLWQDPVPAVDHDLIGESDIAALKDKILASGLSISQLVSTAWAFGGKLPRHRQAGRCERCTDPPGAAKDWEVNEPAELAKVLQTLEQDPAGLQRRTVRREEGLARRRDRPGRVRGRRASGEGRRATTSRFRSRPGARTRRRSKPTSDAVRGARTDRRRVPQLPPSRREAAAGDSGCWTGPTC